MYPSKIDTNRIFMFKILSEVLSIFLDRFIIVESFILRKSFIIFDLCSFYSSITPKILSEALDWAEMYVEITPEERNILL